MKITLSIRILLFILIFPSCRFSTSETFILGEITIYDSLEENEKIGNDLISYNFSKVLKNDLGITDNEVLKNIRYQYFIQDGSKKVILRLILKDKAKEYKDKLVPFFENFVKTELSEYEARKPYLDKVVAKAEDFISLIETNENDSLWNQTAPVLAKMTSREDFYKVLSERNVNFKPEGERIILNRQVYSEMSDSLKGEFYTINFEYKNKLQERITIVRIHDNLKLIGYRYFIPTQ